MRRPEAPLKGGTVCSTRQRRTGGRLPLLRCSIGCWTRSSFENSPPKVQSLEVRSSCGNRHRVDVACGDVATNRSGVERQCTRPAADFKPARPGAHSLSTDRRSEKVRVLSRRVHGGRDGEVESAAVWGRPHHPLRRCIQALNFPLGVRGVKRLAPLHEHHEREPFDEAMRGVWTQNVRNFLRGACL